MNLLDELKAVGIEIETGIEAIAALVWRAIKSAGAQGEQAMIDLTPSLAAAIKDYAAQEVQSIAKDPAFDLAVGSWKFGTAAARVWTLVKADYPAAMQLGAPLLQAAIETAVQAAAAAFLASL